MSIKKFTAMSAAAALSFGLAACSSDEVEDTASDAQTAVSEAADDASSAISDDDTAGSGDGAAATPSRGVDGAKAARDAALDVVAEAGDTGGVVVSQDWEDGVWEIDVVAGTTLHELKVKDDQVIERETDDVDADDTAAASASVSIDDAIVTALESTPGELDEASYDDGRWEIEIDTVSDDVNVYVDAETGEIVN